METGQLGLPILYPRAEGYAERWELSVEAPALVRSCIAHELNVSGHPWAAAGIVESSRPSLDARSTADIGRPSR